MEEFKSSIRKKYLTSIRCEKQLLNFHKEIEAVKLTLEEWPWSQNPKSSSLSYESIFKSPNDEMPVKRILIEGGAGMGKTHFCISLSKDWAKGKGKLLEKFDLLLLLRLRRKGIAEATSLETLLQQLHDSTGTCHSVADCLKRSLGDKVLIIADGWDELQETERIEGSFIYELLFEILPHALVILTSRPFASFHLHAYDFIDRYFRIQGFEDSSIEQYIRHALKCKSGSLLFRQLKSNSELESMCSVPLNCAFVCKLWNSCREETFSNFSMTELYTNIILNVILRNINKYGTHSLSNLSDFNFLHYKDLRESWEHLCKFAFQTMLMDKSSISDKDLDNIFPDVPFSEFENKILCFGLLQSTKSEDEVRQGRSFYFLHHSFQKYLAAFYITQLSCLNFDILAKLIRSDNFAMVWRFLFGMSFCPDSRLKVDISKVLNYLSDCGLLVCQCAYEIRNDINATNEVTRFLNQPQTRVNKFGFPCSAHDCAAVIHVISLMEKCSDMIINFGNSGIQKIQIVQLTEILSNKQGKLQVKELYLSDNNLTDENVSELFQNASIAFDSIQVLNLGGNNIKGESFKTISFEGLLVLNLSHNPLNLTGLQELQKVALPHLQSLTLKECLINDAVNNLSGELLFESVLENCPKLSTIDLSQNNLGIPRTRALAKAISQKNELTKLALNQVKLGNEGLEVFINHLTNKCRLNTLYLEDNNIYGNGISCLIDGVLFETDMMQDLSEIHLDNNPLGLEGTLVIGLMISNDHCKLKGLTLSQCQLTTPNDGILGPTILDVEEILCQRPQSRTIDFLDLSENQFSNEGVNIVGGFFYLCPHLTNLQTRHCEVNSRDLRTLFNQLDKLKSSHLDFGSKLNQWDLTKNEIGDESVSALIEHTPSLFPILHHIGDGILLQGNKISNANRQRIVKTREKCKVTYTGMSTI